MAGEYKQWTYCFNDSLIRGFFHDASVTEAERDISCHRV